MPVPRLGLTSGLLRAGCRVSTLELAGVFNRSRKRSVQWKAGLVEEGETDMRVSHPRKGHGDILNRGSSYKDKWYLIKWPHMPSLLPKMSRRTHRVGAGRGREPRRDMGHLLGQRRGVRGRPCALPTAQLCLGRQGSPPRPGACGPQGAPVWEPVLMFRSAFKKLTVRIPKVLWEFFLFALYHFSGGEARNRW